MLGNSEPSNRAGAATGTAATAAETAATVAVPKTNSSSGAGNTHGEDIVSSAATHNCETLTKLIKIGAFNCKSCGLFFKTAVFCVLDVGTVCETCQNTNQRKGERLQFFDVALADLPTLLPCTNAFAGCQLQVSPENFNGHLKNCRYRLFNCIISPGCHWRGKRNDIAKHYAVHHKSEINSKTAFVLDISRKHFAEFKLVTNRNDKILAVIRREADSEHILYNAFGFGKNFNVTVKHFRHATDDEYYKKCFETGELDGTDGTWSLNKVRLSVLKEISAGQNQLRVMVSMKVKKENGESTEPMPVGENSTVFSVEASHYMEF